MTEATGPAVTGFRQLVKSGVDYFFLWTGGYWGCRAIAAASVVAYFGLGPVSALLFSIFFVAAYGAVDAYLKLPKRTWHNLRITFIPRAWNSLKSPDEWLTPAAALVAAMTQMSVPSAVLLGLSCGGIIAVRHIHGTMTRLARERVRSEQFRWAASSYYAAYVRRLVIASACFFGWYFWHDLGLQLMSIPLVVLGLGAIAMPIDFFKARNPMFVGLGTEAPGPSPDCVIPSFQSRHSHRKWFPPRSRPRSTTHGDARFADSKDDAYSMREALGINNGIWFGFELSVGSSGTEDARYLSYSGERHVLTIAPTGSGKASCAIIPNTLMLAERSVICIDPKGQIAAVTARMRRAMGPVFCLNPFGLHAEPPWQLPQHRFNPLAHLRIESPTLVAEVASLAQALVVTESQTQPYFDNSARDLVKVLILHSIATKGEQATLLDMRGWLGLPLQAPSDQPSLTKIILDMTRSPHAFIREPSGRFLGDAKSIAEVVQSAATQTEFLSDPCIARTLGGSDFSMTEFKARAATLYITLPDTYLDAYARFFRLVVISALDGLRSRPGGMKTVVILDEFARLGHLAAVENAFALARGYNVQLWPLVQDLNQLKDIYRDRWESFIANAGVVQWFTPNDPFTAEYLSKRIGKTTIQTRSANTSTSTNTGAGEGASLAPGPGGRNTQSFNKSSSTSQTSSETVNEAAADFMSPQDLFDLPEYLQIVTLAGFKFPILGTREHYYEWAGRMEGCKVAFDPDPFHPAS